MTGRSTVEVRADLARGHWQLGERSDAIGSLERAAAEDPAHPVLSELAHEFIGDLGTNPEDLELAHRLTQLEGRLEAARQPGPDVVSGSSLATPTMAELLARQGHRDKALEVAEDVLRRNPGDPRALAVRSRLAPGADARSRQIAELERWLGNLKRSRDREARA